MTLEEIAKTYKENEALNLHSENIVLLATYFGSPNQLTRAKFFLEENLRVGYLLYPEDSYHLHSLLYKRFQLAINRLRS